MKSILAVSAMILLWGLVIVLAVLLSLPPKPQKPKEIINYDLKFSELELKLKRVELSVVRNQAYLSALKSDREVLNKQVGLIVAIQKEREQIHEVISKHSGTDNAILWKVISKRMELTETQLKDLELIRLKYQNKFRETFAQIKSK